MRRTDATKWMSGHTEEIAVCGSPVASGTMARQQAMIAKSLELRGFQSQLVVIGTLPQNFFKKMKLISPSQKIVMASAKMIANGSMELLLHNQPRNFRPVGARAWLLRCTDCSRCRQRLQLLRQ